MSGRVDIINSTLGKALGGSMGGYTTGKVFLSNLQLQPDTFSLNNNNFHMNSVVQQFSCVSKALHKSRTHVSFKGKRAVVRGSCKSSEVGVCMFQGGSFLSTWFLGSWLLLVIFFFGIPRWNQQNRAEGEGWQALASCEWDNPASPRMLGIPKLFPKGS